MGDENGESLLDITPDEEDRIMEEAAEFIPACVTAIAAYWRGKGPTQISVPFYRIYKHSSGVPRMTPELA
jgi:hypothetical protein